MTKKNGGVTIRAAKPYLVHLKATVTTTVPNQPVDCTVTLETPRAVTAPKTVDVAAIKTLIEQRDAALKEYQAQSLLVLTKTSAQNADAGNQLRGTLHAVGNELINGLSVRTPATTADVEALAASQVQGDATDSIAELSGQTTLTLQKMMDDLTKSEQATSNALRAYSAAVQALLAKLKA